MAFSTDRFDTVGGKFSEPIWQPATRKTFDSISMKLQDSPMLLVNNGEQVGLFSPLDFGIRNGASPDRLVGFDLKTKFDRFCLASWSLLSMHFLNGDTREGHALDFKTGASKQLLKFDQLPPEILKEIERGRSKGHLASASVGGGYGTTRTPPP